MTKDGKFEVGDEVEVVNYNCIVCNVANNFKTGFITEIDDVDIQSYKVYQSILYYQWCCKNCIKLIRSCRDLRVGDWTIDTTDNEIVKIIKIDN